MTKKHELYAEENDIWKFLFWNISNTMDSDKHNHP